MFRSLFVSTVVASLTLCAVALPSASLNARATDIDDITILNYALTLEHLENNFYHDALAKFDQKAFQKAGYPDYVRERIVEIAAHERSHVDFLAKALGSKATQPCSYKFPYNDPESFLALSGIIEGVGTSAYSGAAPFIANKDYLAAAATILTTEARHASWVTAAANKMAPWGKAFDTPLGPNEVYTLVAPFITSCPKTNPKLPVRAFPTLTLQNAAPGQLAAVGAPSNLKPTYIVFFNGLEKTFVPITNGKVKIPAGLKGQTYAIATKNSTDASDDAIVAGPAILVY
ncbi:ferritin-like domain-containing protein [Crepidotus variabilis]|uniref:Ferritin-like domain-containing protein n=1 Tax=Crepidotus variabilis TaxID=179855 RepID=A0A9P6EQ66_9AGAR|nr:ferritin-like domain-containing protein [Crepidotus variabilis]